MNCPSEEIGTVQLERLSMVSLLRLKALFNQCAQEAGKMGDEECETFLLDMARIIEETQKRNAKAILQGHSGPLN